ncbi:MAG: ribosome recycling factor [Clostridia bacterium]|nr:ribosome recycling factor [Clostridia bacterium]
MLDSIEVLEVFDTLDEKTNKSIEALIHEFNEMKAGRANPHILDKIMVDYYGTPTPIKQIGNVTVPEARMLMIAVWDQSALKSVEKAILAANIGITPTNDGKNIRLVFPELTAERRKELAKQVKAAAENIKVQIRNARRDANDALKKLNKDKLISEDEQSTLEKDVDKNIAQAIEKVDKMTKEKEDEIMSV